MHTEPYTHKKLLEDEKAVDEKKSRLTEELNSYKKYHEELNNVISEMLINGGLKIKWQMN